MTDAVPKPQFQIGPMTQTVIVVIALLLFTRGEDLIRLIRPSTPGTPSLPQNESDPQRAWLKNAIPNASDRLAISEYCSGVAAVLAYDGTVPSPRINTIERYVQLGALSTQSFMRGRSFVSAYPTLAPVFASITALKDASGLPITSGGTELTPALRAQAVASWSRLGALLDPRPQTVPVPGPNNPIPFPGL